MKKSLKEILTPTAALTAVTLVVSAALVFTYNGTKVEQVSDLSDNSLNAAKTLFTNSETFETTQPDGLDERILNVIYPDGDDAVGFEIELKGYSTGLVLVIGINSDGSVLGYEVAESSETPGLGTQVAESDFKDQFIGKKGPLNPVKGKADAENDIVTISGATVSSKAVVEGVNLAIDTFPKVENAEKEVEADE